MPILPYSDFQENLARRRSSQPTIPYELDRTTGGYRPIPPGGSTGRPGRPVPGYGPGVGAIGAAIDGVCLARAIAPNNFVRDLVSASPFDVVPGVRNARERAFNSLCEETPDAAVPLEVPFDGGQCDAVVYNIQVFGFILIDAPACDVQDPKVSQQTQVYGPVGGVRYGGPGLPAAVQVYCRGFASGSIRSPQWIGLTSFGGLNDCNFAGGISSVSISRADGQPDECGDPPLTSTPDSGPSLLPDLNLDIPIAPGASINVPIGVSFNPDVGISIDLGDTNVNFDGVDIDIDFGTDPGANPDIPGAGDDGDRACPAPTPEDTGSDPEEPVEPPPPGNPPAPVDPPDPERVIRGVHVTFSSGLGGSTEVLSGPDTPPVYVPDLGLVMFQVQDSSGQSSWTEPRRCQQRQGYYECPAFFGAVDVKVITRPGLTATLKVVYSDVATAPT